MFIYLFLREKERAQGRDRKRGRESQAGSVLSVHSLKQGSILRTVRS